MSLDSISSEFVTEREKSYYPDWEFVDSLITYNYSWNTVGVWHNKKTDTYWWAEDSGCSCYGPWESLEPEGLTSLDNAHAQEFADAVMGVDGYDDKDRQAFIHRMLREANLFPGVIKL